MAGRHHHFIPRFLQRGFSSGSAQKLQDKVWVFRRGRSPFETNTRNQFVERDFYGPPPEAVVDQLITRHEIRFSRFVTRARSLTGTQSVDPADATDFVSQIASRARWSREFMKTSLHLAFDQLASVWDNESNDRVAAGWKESFERNPDWLYNQLVNEADQQGRTLSPEERDRLSAFAATFRSEPEKLVEYSIYSAEGRDRLREKLTQAVPQAHVRELERSIRSREMGFPLILLPMRNWSVEMMAGTWPLILGDCGALCLDESGVPIGPMGIPHPDEVKAVALPISTSHILIGRREIAGPSVAPAELNEGLAAWSSEAFIASADTVENRELQGMINSRLGPRLALSMSRASAVLRYGGGKKPED